MALVPSPSSGGSKDCSEHAANQAVACLARRLDEEVLRIRFTPFIERTVQAYGVLIDKVYYYHDVLRPYINAPDPQAPNGKRLFRFHRDPRDIGQLYFYDELSQRYVAIPHRDTSLAPVSIWELRQAQAVAETRGFSADDEKLVFGIINEQRALEADAAAKTKVARRSHQRAKEHAKQREAKAKTLPSVTQALAPSTPPSQVRGYDPDRVQPFEDDE